MLKKIILIICIIVIITTTACNNSKVVEPKQQALQTQITRTQKGSEEIKYSEIKELEDEIENVANELSNQIFFSDSLEEVVTAINNE